VGYLALFGKNGQNYALWRALFRPTDGVQYGLGCSRPTVTFHYYPAKVGATPTLLSFLKSPVASLKFLKIGSHDIKWEQLIFSPEAAASRQ
jgi:hypothetical protein